MCLLGTFCNRENFVFYYKFTTKRDVAYKLKFRIMGQLSETLPPR